MDASVCKDLAAVGEVLAGVGHLDNPAYVVVDDVYVGSYLHDGIDAMPIGAVPDLALWCISVVTPSKTFTLATGRVAFVTTRNPAIRKALAHYRTVFSHGRVPQSNELISAAAICLTPPSWVNRWNNWNREQLHYLASEINILNTKLGRATYRLDLPEGGWYLPIRIARSLFGDRVRSSVDALAVPLGRPGEVFAKWGKEGSTSGGLTDAFSIVLSLALRYGVPAEVVVSKLKDLRFEPLGMTDDPEIPEASSTMDRTARRIALDHLSFCARKELDVLTAEEEAALPADAYAPTPLVRETPAASRSA